MKKALIAVLSLVLILGLAGCGDEKTVTPTSAPTSTPTEAAKDTPTPTEVPTDTPTPTEAPTDTPTPTEAPTEAPTNTPAASENVTDEQALEAVKNYCYAENAELKSIVESNQYKISWEVTSSSAEQIVVLYKTYTDAEVRYYIDPVSGETYITEFVPGITSQEMKSDITFNIRDYIK